ncbi:hypothetical protein G6F35_013853 [Rhizopus arrhizus]|nr:hypothetical protein G6F35_013853 [Rhizopus arrhizus]
MRKGASVSQLLAVSLLPRGARMTTSRRLAADGWRKKGPLKAASDGSGCSSPSRRQLDHAGVQRGRAFQPILGQAFLPLDVQAVVARRQRVHRSIDAYRERRAGVQHQHAARGAMESPRASDRHPLQPGVAACRRVDQVEIPDRAIQQAALHLRVARKRIGLARRQRRLFAAIHGQLNPPAFQHGDDALQASEG